MEKLKENSNITLDSDLDDVEFYYEEHWENNLDFLIKHLSEIFENFFEEIF